MASPLLLQAMEKASIPGEPPGCSAESLTPLSCARVHLPDPSSLCITKLCPSITDCQTPPIPQGGFSRWDTWDFLHALAGQTGVRKPGLGEDCVLSEWLGLKNMAFGTANWEGLYAMRIWMPLQSVRGLGWGRLSHGVCWFT